ncbi:hypothetical protein DFJ58DRAFT_893266 [Suillus subalutaceus]|uniref:uncharacterized protein n=1 Tax=Suillus subalutaceus TaxID=48586 RepID=UPI001B8610F6|nr:uncharacterized protein DFJ58DRAFT_893266 [Suillus subalutaceus]KAG1846100.1 hypothetical protein DFJ58DRAFT_893266 [Suillus subalutaceus]
MSIFPPPLDNQCYRPRSDKLSDLGSSDAPVLEVTLLESKRMNEACCVQREVSIVPVTSTNLQDAVVFTHLPYVAWPDHGVLEDEYRASLLAFVHFLDRASKDTSSLPSSPEPDSDPPIVVNCTTDIGQTGSFIAKLSLSHEYHLSSGNPPLNTLAPLFVLFACPSSGYSTKGASGRPGSTID